MTLARDRPNGWLDPSLHDVEQSLIPVLARLRSVHAMEHTRGLLSFFRGERVGHVIQDFAGLCVNTVYRLSCVKVLDVGGLGDGEGADHCSMFCKHLLASDRAFGASCY